MTNTKLAAVCNFDNAFLETGTGAEYVVQAVATSRALESLDFTDCKMVGKAWQHFEGHDFPQLKLASFDRVLIDSGTGAEYVLQAIAKSRALESLDFSYCRLVGKAWKHLENHDFPQLKVANFDNAFLETGAGAEYVVQAVATSRALESLHFTSVDLWRSKKNVFDSSYQYLSRFQVTGMVENKKK